VGGPAGGGEVVAYLVASTSVARPRLGSNPDDDYVSLTAFPEIWDEYGDGDERRIRRLFDAEPVAILLEYRDRETACELAVGTGSCP